jgi:hypothetical protein
MIYNVEARQKKILHRNGGFMAPPSHHFPEKSFQLTHRD